MPRLVLTISDEDRIMLESAAGYARLPISLWARGELIKVARSIEHKILCTPKTEKEAPLTPEQAQTKKNYDKRLKEVDKMEMY